MCGDGAERLKWGNRLKLDIAVFRFGGGAGIARRDQHFGDAPGLRELPGEGVFAAAGVDDEKFHERAFFMGRKRMQSRRRR